MPLRVVYETHATSTDNELGVATGWAPGELSATGIENARELGRRRQDDGIDLVVSSDLHRAVRTVDLAFAGSSVPRRMDARLREVDYGSLTRAPVDVVHAQRRQRVDEAFPGGQSYRDVSDGVRSLLDELRRDHDGDRVLLVGHAATRFALDHLLTGRPLESAVCAPFAWRPGWEYVVLDEPPRVEVLDGAQARAFGDELVCCYRAAFTALGYDETEEQVQRFATQVLPRHTGYDGYRLVTVRQAGELRGFGYGYTGEPGMWWTDRIAATTPAEARGVLDDWLGGHFEVAEVAVDPRAQGRGFGATLMDTLVLGRPHRRALLSTYAGDRPAPRLYERLGWERLVRGVLDGDSDLWGLRLPPP